MFTNYADCEIEFHPREDKSYSLTLRSPGGDANGVLHLPNGDPAYHELAESLKNLQTDEEIITRIGQMLFGALFQGKIKERYSFSQGTLQAGQGLRLVLNIGADEQEAGAIPWEFLYDPDQAGPMNLIDMPIVRYLPQPLRMPILKTDLPLKVLLTGAHTPAPLNAIPGGARDQTPENITRELAEVHAALAGMGDHVRIEVEEHITTGKLQKFLRQRDGFHVWHFVGHGSVNANGTAGRLQFEDGAGGMSPVSAQQLGILLNRSVRLVVLNSCQSGQLALDPFRSMAPALIRAQIPAVVAMQFSVPQRSARAFAVEFYRALAEGFPIDACVTEGRKAVMNEVGLDRADWGIPVVYTRAEDGRLFDLPPLMPSVPKPALQAHETISNGNRLGTENSLEQSAGQIGKTGDRLDERMKDMDILAAYKQLPLTEQRPRLRQFLLAHFDEDEINDLCFDLRINVQDLGVEGRKNKVRALIEYCERHSRIDDLVIASSRLHPDEDWVGLSQQPSPASASQPVREIDNTAAREAIAAELDMKTRYLYDLKLKAAMQGINTPPDVNIQIENIEGKRDQNDNIIREGELDKLKRRLKELGG